MDSTSVVRIPFPREPASSTWPPQAPAPSLTVDQEAGIWAEGLNDDISPGRRASMDLLRQAWSPQDGWVWSRVNTLQVPRFPRVWGDLVGPMKTLPLTYQSWTPGTDWLWADTVPAVQQGVAAWQSQMIQEYRLRAQAALSVVPEWAQRMDWAVSADIGPQVASWAGIFETETQQAYRLGQRQLMEPFRWWQPEKTDWLYGPSTANLPSQWPAVEELTHNADMMPGRRKPSVREEWTPQYGWIVSTFGIYDPTPFPRPHGDMSAPGRGRQQWALPTIDRQGWLYGAAVAALSRQWPGINELLQSALPPVSRQRIRADEWGDGPGWILATFPPTFDPQVFPRALETLWLWKPKLWPQVSSRGQGAISVPPVGAEAFEVITTHLWARGKLAPIPGEAQGIGWVVSTFPPTFDVRLFPYSPEPYMMRMRPKLRNEWLTTIEIAGMPQTLARLIPFGAAMEQLRRSEYRLQKRPPLGVWWYEWPQEFGWMKVYIPTPPSSAVPADFMVWMRRRRR